MSFISVVPHFMRKLTLSSSRPGLIPLGNRVELVDRVCSLGMTKEQLVRNTRIPKDALSSPTRRFRYRELIQLLTNIDIQLGLNRLIPDQSEAFSIASYGMLGYAMMSKADLRQALEVALKYYRTAGPLCDIQFIQSPSHMTLTANNALNLNNRILHFILDEVFCSFPGLLFELVGTKIIPTRVEFQFLRPDNAEKYRRSI